MKKLFTFVCTLVLGASLSFAQTGGASGGQTGSTSGQSGTTSGSTDTKGGKKHHVA